MKRYKPEGRCMAESHLHKISHTLCSYWWYDLLGRYMDTYPYSSPLHNCIHRTFMASEHLPMSLILQQMHWSLHGAILEGHQNRYLSEIQYIENIFFNLVFLKKIFTMNRM